MVKNFPPENGKKAAHARPRPAEEHAPYLAAGKIG
eukprot:CAMPEP_0206475360 /NCGR_PEP_ID=MMETSP0324_2-20121206/34028_1 /ASSEMBLY_ACC=CAM_ASM_000836 /TAXON_ID=2866 /ORGANISM="Crypthecodinium cohnii, Strain Seligo" /LENGTH=34 /DNA_ID= /DNA_START= /DNA_END= /DNA_ORIENTATION=